MPVPAQPGQIGEKLSRSQALRADLGAVHDRAAAVEAIDVVEEVQALGGGGVAAVGDEAVGLQQARRPNELVRIPPVGRAERTSAGAQPELVQPVLALAPCRAPQPFALGQEPVVHQPGLDGVVMGEELRHVHDQVAYHRKAGQRTQHDRLFQPVERGQTGEAVGVVDGRTESFSPEPSWGNGDLTAAVSNRSKAVR